MRYRQDLITVEGERTIIGEDSYGDPVYGETLVEVAVHSVQPALVDEAGGVARWSTTEMDVYSYRPLDIGPKESVWYKGRKFQANGETQAFHNAYTGTEVYRQRIVRAGDAT